MSNVITELLYYDCNVSEKINYGENYEKLNNKSYQLYKKITSILKEDELKLFIEFVDLSYQIEDEACAANFREGIKKAFYLVLDLLKEN